MLNRLSSVSCRYDMKCVCVVIFLLTIANLFIVSESYNARDCGVPLRRHTRQPRDRTPGQLRIIKGRESKRGAWPWQVSLQLLHPSFGFIGHWCGGVLVHPYWLLTAAHCIHNELFNLPIAALWTAVLGEWGRSEQRGAYVPIERIVLHQRFHHYQHDIALMKMTKSADLTASSKIRTICLPPIKRPNNDYQHEKTSTFYVRPVGVNINKHNKRKQINKPSKPNPDSALKYLEKLNNLTKSVLGNFFAKKNKNMRYNIRVSNNDSEPKDNNEDSNINNNNKGRKNEASYDGISLDSVVKLIRDQVLAQPVVRRKGDGQDERIGKKLMYGEEIDPFIEETNGLGDGGECYATGWGRQQTNGTLTDILLEAVVPTLPIQACRDKYPLSLPLMEGHLCAGNVDGSTGTCVGDSGGPLQCLGADGRWVLRGITSFGSGCAQPGVPDVYTYVPHYVAWIHSVIDAD